MTNITKEYLDYCSKHSKDYGDNIIVLLKVGAFFVMYGVKDKNDNVLGSNVEDIYNYLKGVICFIIKCLY